MGLDAHELLILDGACGTNLQEAAVPAAAWQGREGCNEWLNVAAGEVIVALHRSFLEAGAMVLETNTFGASRVVLAEYGLEDEVETINRAAVEHARTAIGGRPNRYVAASIGPTTKLPSLGHIDRDALADAYHEQCLALVHAGVDLFVIETCQDLLQAKTALVVLEEIFASLERRVPVILSVTIERTGSMLVGSDIAAVAATVEPFPLFALGLNCATGPAEMESHIRFLSRHWPGRISCIPNQGLPEVEDGKTVYRMTPDAFADQMTAFVEQFGVSVVGGCCGTTPEHIRRLVDRLEGVRPAARNPSS